MFSLEEKDELVPFVANRRAEIMISPAAFGLTMEPPEDQLELLPNGLLRLGTSLSEKLLWQITRICTDLSQQIMTFCSHLFADNFMIKDML